MRPLFSSLLCCTLAWMSASAVLAADSLGNVTFVGDSITQGFSGHASFRYQVWKGFVDNGLTSGKDYKFTGSITGSWYGGDTDPVDKLTPSYAGQQFDNTHEGHYNWRASWIAGSEALPDNETTNNRGSGTAADWVQQYDSDTIFVMLGTNDLYKGRTTDQLIQDVHSIVSTYQQANPNARVYVLSVTPPKNVNGMPGKVEEANRLAGEQAAGWSTETSQVSYLDVNRGMGSNGVMNTDNWHPKAQGELIIAGNILKELGLNRTGGLERKSALTTAYTPSASEVIGSGTAKNDWTFKGNSATIASAGGNSALSHAWNAAGGDFTLEFTVRLGDQGDSNNFFAAWAGNGKTGGSLLITEDAVQWGLFGSVTTLYYTDATSQDLTLRLAYTQGDAEAGIKAGYYVWLDGVLIGDALTGSTDSNVISDRVLLGAYTSSQVSYADVSDINFQTGAALAPGAWGGMIPEPTSATLLLGAFAALGWQRRRPNSRHS